MYSYEHGDIMKTKSWEECLFLEGQESIKTHFGQSERVLLIVGLGFDARACRVAKIMTESVKSISVCLVDYAERGLGDNQVNTTKSKQNYADLQEICQGVPCVEKSIPMYLEKQSEKTLIVSESVRNAFDQEFLSSFDKMIVDVSAMPRGVWFSIFKRLMDIKGPNQKLYIAVCENSKYDDLIKPRMDEDTAEYLPGFNRFSMSLEQDNDEIVWFPILGMDNSTALEIVSNYLKPREICPVVPFPSQDVRRGEKILRSCGNLLFRDREVERRNIIYVPESNPVLVYQKLYETVMYYERAFNIDTDRGVKYAFSSQSSKLIDIGVLLAMIDLTKRGIKTGIVVVKNEGYAEAVKYHEADERLYCLCLDDNIYEW